MAHTPTGNPRGRPKGSGLLLGEVQTRVTIRIPQALYEALEERAVALHYTRGAPELARTIRDALAHYLTCPHYRQTENRTGDGPHVLSRQAGHSPKERPGQSVQSPPEARPHAGTEAEEVCLPENGARTARRVQPAEVVPPFDTRKHTLGKLCPRGHAYHGSGQSLLRLANLGCLACDAEKARARRQAKRQATS